MCGWINPIFLILGQGIIVSLIVDRLKRIPWVKQDPQRAAAVLNGIAAVLGGVVVCGADIGQLIGVWAGALATSIATHEVTQERQKADEAPGDTRVDSDRSRLR